METNWAAENLQTIRTLMERSSLYRRALAPVMTFTGVTGILGGVVGWALKLDSSRGFVSLWFGIAAVAITGSFLLIRRQALKEAEPFWSPPTKRVAQALTPAFMAGAIVAIPFLLFDWQETAWVWWLPVIWPTFYGLAMHSAGFFMPRGIRWFAWGFLLCGTALFGCGACLPRLINPVQEAHLIMGAMFGGLHLGYGIYLYFTEKRGNES